MNEDWIKKVLIIFEITAILMMCVFNVYLTLLEISVLKLPLDVMEVFF